MNSTEPKVVQTSGEETLFTVTANFTAEPVGDVLRFWLERLGLEPGRLEFSSYNQVFQELMAPGSALASSAPGVNFLLVRFEDWARDQSESLRTETIAASAREFVIALDDLAKRARRPTVLLLCPPSRNVSADLELAGVLQRLEGDVRQAVAGLRGVSVITSEEVAALYPVDEVDDPEGDRQGHIPFTRAYWVALGTILARKARTFLRPPHKVIAVDADNTLWGGVVAEAGADQLQVAGEWSRLQEYLHGLKQQGILLVLVSKNKEEDVAEAFRRPGMVLRREDFVAWKVNWKPKSENLRALAAELSLGLDSFIFLDDNPMECAEVAAHCPSVTVLPLPSQAGDVHSFLRHVWAFDLPPTTSADTGRTEQYRQQADRQQFQASANSFREFLEKLELRVDLAAPRPEQFERAAQLTQRTNQFNATGVRRTASELGSLIASGERQALLVRVRDRFGDYGEVGLCVYALADSELIVENFLLSCRVLGKGVEHRLLSELGGVAGELGKGCVVIPFRPTDRNEPAARFLDAVGRAFEKDNLYRFPARHAKAVVFDPDSANESLPTDDADSAVRATGPVARCDYGEIGRNLAKVAEIQFAIRKTYLKSRPGLQTQFVAPRNPLEHTLAEIWANVLDLDRVGIHDNFFDLGGDSILSIQIISKASASGLRFTLRQQFQYPTIGELGSVIETAPAVELTAQQGLVTGTAPLTPIQCWFFEKELPEPHHWNMEMLLEARQELSPDLIGQALAHLTAQHDALRLRFHRGDQGWRQDNSDEETNSIFERYDFSALPVDAQDLEMRKVAVRAHSSLNLEHGPLLRAVWFELGQARASRLLIVLHHLIVDGITWRVLLEDLQTAYRQLIQAQPVRFPSKSNSYLDWAKGAKDYANGSSLRGELSYWRGSGRGASVSLPVDYPDFRHAGTEDTARIAVTSLDASETRSLLVEAPKAYQTQINDLLLTALLKTFHRWTGHRSLLIDLEGHGREAIIPDLDLSRTAGWFTSIFPVLLRIDQPDSMSGSLKSVKEQLRRIPNRGIGYGLLCYMHADKAVRDSLRHLPNPEVMFNYLGQFDQVLPTAGLFQFAPGGGSGSLLHGPQGRRSHLIEIIGRVVAGQLHLEWTYSERVFERSTVEELALRLGEDLRGVVQHCLSPEAGGFTPSDFPLARLGQRSLDQVLARLSKAPK